jgi:hypothetical protein
VDAIVWAVLTAWVLLAGVFLFIVLNADDPGVPMMLMLTPANVAVLKNGRAKAVRFSTLEAMCKVLGCQPGDLLEWVED